MAKYTLGSTYEWIEDKVNNQSIIEALNTGKQFVFREDGTFESPAVSTDSAIIGGHDTIKGIEAGTVSHGDPGSASDGTWDTSNQNTQSVSFAQSFSTTPKVAISANTGTYGVVYRYNVSTTGFSSSWRIFRSDASASTDADWVAVEV